MKRIHLYLLTAVYALFLSSPLAGQCVPDLGCVDIDQPGEICPATLPSGIVGQTYSQAITILPPDEAVESDLPIDIAYIIIDSVKNLPPGLTYTAYNDKYYPDTAYCIDIEGIPTSEGEYNLEIYVSPYIIVEIVPGVTTIIGAGQVVDDSSVVVTISSGTSIDPFGTKKFQVLNAQPNPFKNSIRLGYYIPYDGKVELKIYNILGEEMYTEVMLGMHGENYFNFDGSQLDRGAFLFGISYNSDWYTGKIIKTE